MSIVLVLINFNGIKFFPRCLDSILAQKQDLSFTIIDNVSTDSSVEYFKKNFPQIELIENKHNNGYTGAANQAYEIAKKKNAKYLMIINPDIVLPPDYIQKALTICESDPKIAAFTGKILRYDFDTDQPTEYIDSVGLHCYRNRRIVDYGQGQKDHGQFDEPREVFGVSGSCPIYRLEALSSVAIPHLSASHQFSEADNQTASEKKMCTESTHEIFDEDFFMYKEDVDISWRLSLFGWKNFYHPDVVGYHGRGTGILQEHDHVSVFKNRRNASSLAKYHAYKNQRLMMIKNEQPLQFLKDFPHILFKEILITGYIIFREPRLIKAFFHLLRQIPNAIRKRLYISRQKKSFHVK